MTTDTQTQATECAGQPDQHYVHHARSGSTARMAVLSHLAEHPEGVTIHQLRAAMVQTVGHPLADHTVGRVIQSLRADGLIARELHKPDATKPAVWLWFSPASRQAAQIRGTWSPQAGVLAAPTTTAGTTAGATDPNTD